MAKTLISIPPPVKNSFSDFLCGNFPDRGGYLEAVVQMSSGLLKLIELLHRALQTVKSRSQHS